MSPSFQVLFWGSMVLVVDQLTKFVILERFALGEVLSVIPGFFDLTYITNSGAAWGIMKDRALGITLLSVVALGTLYYFREHFIRAGIVSKMGLSLLLGGISGNLCDRIVYGHVIDFLSFHAGRFYWPAFNVADSAICVGSALYVLQSLRRQTPLAPVVQNGV